MSSTRHRCVTPRCTAPRLDAMTSSPSDVTPRVDGRRSAAAARRRQREREILEATRALFDERGVRDAQIEDIAQAVGINRAIVYRHFTGKEELFALTLVGYLDELRVALLTDSVAELDRQRRPGAAPSSSAFVDYGLGPPGVRRLRPGADAPHRPRAARGDQRGRDVPPRPRHLQLPGGGRRTSSTTASSSGDFKVPGHHAARQPALRQRPRRPPARPRRHAGQRGGARHPGDPPRLRRAGQDLPRDLRRSRSRTRASEPRSELSSESPRRHHRAVVRREGEVHPPDRRRPAPSRARRGPAVRQVSPPAGPAAVAPTSTPLVASATSLISALVAGPSSQPRADSGSSACPVRTSSPCSRACASVSPTEPDLGVGEGHPADRPVVRLERPVLTEDVRRRRPRPGTSRRG